MNYSVYSVNYAEKDLRAREFLYQKDMPYNYGTFVVKSTSVDYSDKLLTYITSDYEDILLEGILREYAGAWKKLAEM